MRLVSMQVVVLPATTKYLVTSKDRELKWNINVLKTHMYSRVVKRRQQIKDGTHKYLGDLLDILSTDEQYKDDDSLIVDECLTFLFAGT